MPSGDTTSPGRPAPVPALRRGLAVLQLLASRPAPLSAAAIARELGLPRSSVYELLTELAGAGFAVHLPAERRWGLGVSAFEIGSAYLRGDPLERLGRPILHRLAGTLAGSPHGPGATAHLGVLHGAQILYLLKDRAGTAGPTLVTDVGVRLPAALTATGLCLLADLPAAQIRALFPGPGGFVLRTGTGPRSLPELRSELRRTRRRGWAVEHARVSPDTASVAVAVHDHLSRPLAAIGVTVRHRCSETDCGATFPDLAGAVAPMAAELTAAVGGRPPG